MTRSSAIVTLVLIVFFASTVKCKNRRLSVENNHHRQHEVPKPHLEALYPKGIRVSTPDIPGMELFAFHGKVNSPITRTESGNLSKDVYHPINGQWIFEDHNVQLRIGDVVNYWVFVQINSMGYRLDNLSTVIRELVPAQKTTIKDTQNTPPNHLAQQGLSLKESGESHDCSYTQNNRRKQVPTTQSPASCSCNLNELKTISSQLNIALEQLSTLNDAVVPLRSQVESLRELLQELFKDKNIGTQLLLTGQEPPGRNPLEAIRQLVAEKLELLDLEQKIENAYPSRNGILFEVSSPIDKKRILFRAESRLKNSNYKIRDPQESTDYIESNTPSNAPFISAMMMRFGELNAPETNNRQRISNQGNRGNHAVQNNQNSYASRDTTRQHVASERNRGGDESGQKSYTTRQPNRNSGRTTTRSRNQGSSIHQQSDSRNQIDPSSQIFSSVEHQVASERSTHLQSQEEFRREQGLPDQNVYSRTTRKPSSLGQRTGVQDQSHQTSSFQRASGNHNLRPLFL